MDDSADRQDVSAPNAGPKNDAGRAISHVPALDGVRGIAILLVVTLHFGVAADFPNRSGITATRWLERLFYTGWSGVDLFFVLSGFLITSILVASRSEAHYFRRFYGRRVLRIFPLYYAALVLGLILIPSLLPQRTPQLLEDAVAGQAWLWTYSLNFAMVFGRIGGAGVLGHFWTLAIEEQYYIFWPWIVKTLSNRAMLLTCGVLVIGALLLRIVWMALGLGWEGAYRFTLTRVDAFGTGALIAFLVRTPRWRKRLVAFGPYGLVAGFLVIGAIFLAVPHFYPSEWVVVTFGHSVLAAMFGCLVLIGLRDPAPRWLSGDALSALGRYSYGLYVWHWPLQRMLLAWYAARPIQARPSAGLLDALTFLVTGMVGSALLGWASYQLLEQPFLRLKRYFAYGSGREPWKAAERLPATPVS